MVLKNLKGMFSFHSWEGNRIGGTPDKRIPEGLLGRFLSKFAY